LEEGEKAVLEELEKIKQEYVTDVELEKVKNKVESMLAFEDISLMNRADNLANYELLGNAALIKEELGYYFAVTPEDIQTECAKIFVPENCSTLYYRSETLQK